jgi:hypothetical protein
MMRRSRSWICGIVVFLLVCGTLVESRAGTITSVSTFALPGFSTGSINPGNTPAPNNDNVAGPSPNTIVYNIFFNTFGTAEFEFIVAQSGGTTEYRVVTGPLPLVNNTGQVWTAFHFELGYGLGAQFVRSGAVDALDFDTPARDPAPTASRFLIPDHQADTLTWVGGTVPSIGAVAFSFAIDVPDNLQAFHPSGANRFTLRQAPTLPPTAIPEPSIYVLFGTGLLGLLGYGWRKRKHGA